MDTSTIVAVASSAGDPEAVSELLSALRGECGAAFIIVQHLDSGRERLLFEALGSSTILPVMFCSPRLRKSRDVARSAWSSRAKAPTVPSAYKPSSKAVAPHLHSTRGLLASPACPSAPLQPGVWISCCARMRSPASWPVSAATPRLPRALHVARLSSMTMRGFLAGAPRRRSILLSVDRPCGVTSPQEQSHGIYTGRSPRFIHAGG